MAYRNVRDKTALVLFAIPILALLIWYFYSSHGPARLLLSCYVLVATLFFLLVGSYPPFGTRWFWKSDDIDSSARWCLRVRSSSDNRLVPIYRHNAAFACVVRFYSDHRLFRRLGSMANR